jgi:predicted nucleotidyltransferase
MTTTLLRGTPQSVQNNPRLQATLRDLSIGLRQIYGLKTPRIILYGSFARNEASENSDVDILLLFSHPIRTGTEIDRVSPLLADLNLRHEMLIAIVPATEQQYRQEAGPFWNNVRREGMEINGS